MNKEEFYNFIRKEILADDIPLGEQKRRAGLMLEGTIKFLRSEKERLKQERLKKNKIKREWTLS